MLSCPEAPLKCVELWLPDPVERTHVARFLLPIVSSLLVVFPTFGQDSGSRDREFHGSGAEITVTVHDGSEQPISSVAIVKLLRGGAIPTRQAETSHGRAVLVVNTLGEFTVIVEAAGYETAQKEVSIRTNGTTELDIYLRRPSVGPNNPSISGRSILAPKAKEALEKGFQALKRADLQEAEKYLNEAMRLAPGNSNVLYFRGVLSLQQHRWVEAQEVLEKATQLDQSNAPAFAALGMAFCDQQKYDAAIAPLEKSLQLDSTNKWDTRWALANAYYKQEQYEQALKISQEALAGSNGSAPEIALLIAQSLAAVGRYDDAAQVLRAFLRDHGDRREATTAQRWLDRLTASGKLRAN
jgi:Tfp pilus assembly protein PilF